jgi:type I restriction enzyme, S subunit
MNEWNSISLRELIGKPISGSRPTGGVNVDTEGVPSLGGENILASGGVDFTNLNRVSDSFYRAMPKGQLYPLDVLINKDGAQTGKVGLYRGDFSHACVNEHLFILRNQNRANDQQFLFYSVLLPETQTQIARRITGSAQPGLNTTFVNAVKILIPENANEQKRIAEILSTLDAVIEQTEALIAKGQKIKAGLMHDLFTRGVTPDGHLRPPPAEAPHLYKQSPLGWIPKEWEVKPLRSLAEIVSGVTLSAKIEITDGIKVPYLRVANVQDGYFNLKEIKKIRVSRPLFEKLQLKFGDVLMNEGGDFDKLGRGSVWREEINPCIHQNHVFRVRARDASLRPDFLAFWSQTEMGKKYFILSSKQSTNLASINSTQLNRFPIVQPCPLEQERIEKRIMVSNNHSVSQQMKLEKFRQLKSGLMHDLLTGRVRVKIPKTAGKAA